MKPKGSRTLLKTVSWRDVLIDEDRAPVRVALSHACDREQCHRRIVERVKECYLRFVDRGHWQKPDVVVEWRTNFRIASQNKFSGFHEFLGVPCTPNQHSQLAFE